MLKTKYIFFDFSGTVVKMRPAKLMASRSLLNLLSRQYLLGIITGAKRSETYNILKKINIINKFKIIITKDDSEFCKPNPQLFPKVLIKAYIGDSKKDQQLAINAKLPFFRVNKKCKINKVIRELIK